MDLEHTNLGNHCEVSDCKQRDFLPFTCDVCHKKLCLAHRTYAAHACNGAATKDMTSIDCPMCGISVKFPKSEDPDTIWNTHYVSNCTQKMKKKVEVHCYEKSCQILLGPSNDYVCAKCKQHVCLTHRVPEEHHCLGMRGAILSKLPTQATTGSSSQAKSSQSKPTQSKPVPSSKPSIASNTTSGGKSVATSSSVQPSIASADIRYDNIYKNSGAKKTPAVAAPPPEFECPFCSQKFPNSDVLQSHVNSAHSDFDTPAPPAPIRESVAVTAPTRNSDPNRNNPRAREVCPQCQMRFVDAIELVNHFETAHPPQALPPKKNDDCIII